jgi:hypothetical protein
MLSERWTKRTSIERFGSVLPNFVFPSVPRLCSGPAFSEICFGVCFGLLLSNIFTKRPAHYNEAYIQYYQVSVFIQSVHLFLVLCSSDGINFLPLWNRFLLEKLTGFQLAKKFPAFYRTRRFITSFASARHLSLSWASSIQFIIPHPTSWKSILILSSHLRLGLPTINLYWHWGSVQACDP